MQKVFFHYVDKKLNIQNKRDIQRNIIKLFRREGKEIKRMDYIFCSDEYLLEINRNHLNHDFYTDIITFELSATKATIAEIYISMDRVKENAQNLDIPFNKEILRVIIHGALHLCGYKDKSKKDINIMRAKEDYYIDNFLNS